MSPGRDQRRAPRKRATSPIPVTDVFLDRVIGQLGDLSTGGLMLIGPEAPLPLLVRMVSFVLDDAAGEAHRVDVGIQALWHEPAAARGQCWSGYRLIAARDDDMHHIDHWVGTGAD